MGKSRDSWENQSVKGGTPWNLLWRRICWVLCLKALLFKEPGDISRLPACEKKQTWDGSKKWGDSQLPSGKHTKNYGTWPSFFVDLPIRSGDFPVRYVRNYQICVPARFLPIFSTFRWIFSWWNVENRWIKSLGKSPTFVGIFRGGTRRRARQSGAESMENTDVESLDKNESGLPYSDRV